MEPDFGSQSCDRSVNLTELFLSNNQISDLGPLSGLPNLTRLSLGGNQISDISPLVRNPVIDSGDWVDLVGNPLSTDSCNHYIPELETRGDRVQHDCP